MFKNYLKIAYRNILKHKVDSAINLVGLCVAFTAALLIFLSVFFEFSYDNFHKNKNDIYHIYTKMYNTTGAEVSTAIPVPMTTTLKNNYPEVLYAARYLNKSGHVRYNDKQLNRDLRLTDPDFLKMFSFPLIKGDAATALNDLNNIVLSEKAAEAIFGAEDGIGKTIELKSGEDWKPFIVSAIISNLPDNSSIQYDMLARFENDQYYNQNLSEWNNWTHSAYIQLKDGVSPQLFSKKANAFYDQYFSESITQLKRDGAKPADDGAFMQLGLMPLADVHTATDVLVEGRSIGANYLYLLLGIGILILLIASINFINLSIGRSFTRSHEIGLRKTLGALQSHVVLQLWVEALLLCFIALAMSAVLTYVLLPHYTQLFQMSVAREILYSPSVWIAVLLGFLLISIIAGGYPAWMIARVNIISIFKGKFSIRTSHGLRNSLIVVQFAIAVLLMICTFVTWQQVNYLRSRPIGFNRNQVISVPIEGNQNPNVVLERLRQKLSSNPQIESVSGIYNNLGRGLDGSTRSSVVSFDYKNKTMRSTWLGISYDFTKTMDLQLVEGRDFSRQFPTDSNAMIINESMAKQIGEKNLIGLQLPVHDSARPMTVIGIVKDFNYESLHKKIGPVSFVIEEPFGVHYALIKVTPANLPQSMNLIAGVWKEILPNAEFKGSFVDENIERQYRREAKMGQIFVSGALIAIVLSCMGLLAMVILIVTQRVKEIGIRKVLGASIPNIVMLISKDFIWLVLIAFVIAAPIGWWSMQQWLDNFAYRINIEWWVFALVALLAVFIAFLTVSIQALRAATANPIKNLRTE